MTTSFDLALLQEELASLMEEGDDCWLMELDNLEKVLALTLEDPEYYGEETSHDNPTSPP